MKKRLKLGMLVFFVEFLGFLPNMNQAILYKLPDGQIAMINPTCYPNISDECSVYGNDRFRMHYFKIKMCPKNRSHDWTECPFAHPGERAQRRDPKDYVAIVCPEFRNGSCSKGDACIFAHGVFEFWLHPAKYRTKACTASLVCDRKVCFFAHTAEQLRPETKYICKVVHQNDDLPTVVITSVETNFIESGGGRGPRNRSNGRDRHQRHRAAVVIAPAPTLALCHASAPAPAPLPAFASSSSMTTSSTWMDNDNTTRNKNHSNNDQSFFNGNHIQFLTSLKKMNIKEGNADEIERDDLDEDIKNFGWIAELLE